MINKNTEERKQNTKENKDLFFGKSVKDFPSRFCY